MMNSWERGPPLFNLWVARVQHSPWHTKIMIITDIVESLLSVRHCAKNLTTSTRTISVNPKNPILHVRNLRHTEVKYFTQCHPLAIVTYIINTQYVFGWKNEVNVFQSRSLVSQHRDSLGMHILPELKGKDTKRGWGTLKVTRIAEHSWEEALLLLQRDITMITHSRPHHLFLNWISHKYALTGFLLFWITIIIIAGVFVWFGFGVFFVFFWS